MRWNELAEETCSLARTLSVIGDRWTLLIIRNCFLGQCRFDEIQQQLGITRHVLSDRLKVLVDAEILQKKPYESRTNRFEYRLTQKGLELQPILMAINCWGDKWMSSAAGPPIEFVHSGCGHAMHAKSVCDQCNEELNARNTRARPGPEMMDKLSEEEQSDMLHTFPYLRN